MVAMLVRVEGVPYMKAKDKIIGRPIRLNQKTLKVKRGNDYSEVVFLGDIHYGSPQCDVKRFRAMIDYCLKNSIYVFLMGDLIEVATRNSVGAGVYEQECATDSQHEQMVEWLRPLAEAGLILGSHAGNHEERVYKDTGVNIAKALARELKITYLGDACWNKFKVGNESYNIYSLHGRSGSRFDGTALLALERISTSFFADLVACGHSHKCINSIVVMQKVVDRQVMEHKKHLLICGAYLKYDRGYGQTIGLPISKLGSPKVKFFSKKHDIVVSW
jgi:UDP-2,3-diacylglucosamine pyrophosphatase LpxH